MPPNSPCSFSIIHYATSSVGKCHNRESMAVRVSKLRFKSQSWHWWMILEKSLTLFESQFLSLPAVYYSQTEKWYLGDAGSWKQKCLSWDVPAYFFTLPQPSPRWEATLNHSHVCSEFLSPNIRSWRRSTETVNPRTQEHWKRAAARASWE